MSFVGLVPRGGLLGRAEVLVPRLEVIVLGRTPVGYGLKTSNSFSQLIHEIQFLYQFQFQFRYLFRFRCQFQYPYS